MKVYVSVVSYDNSPENQNIDVLTVSTSRKKAIEAAKRHYDQIMNNLDDDELIPEQTTEFSVETPDSDECLGTICTTDYERYMYVVMKKDIKIIVHGISPASPATRRHR